MRYRTKRKYEKERNDFTILIEYQKLLHYDDLLRRKIDKMNLLDNNKFNNSKLITIFSFFITIMGFTSDGIGIKILKTIPGWKDILLIIILVTPSILSLIHIFKIKKSIKDLDIEFMKRETEQEKILFKYIVEKVKKERELGLLSNNLDYDFKNNYQEIVEYYFLGNSTKVILNKCDLEYFIYKYNEKNNNIIDDDISVFLSEIIISRGLIENKIKRNMCSDEFEYIIDKANIMHIAIVLQ
ncbi:MAG TPA: hypothetical protein DIT16_09070 [Clostridium sp.]|nr:hypothetical protein [Clostridium sp.]